MLSKEAIQAAMSQRADSATQREDASSRVDANQALSAVAGIVLAPKVQAQSKHCTGASTAPIDALLEGVLSVSTSAPETSSAAQSNCL